MFAPCEGQLFGKYRILSPLGKGAMGAVYLAEDTTLGREVALKVLDPAMTATLDFETRFRLEARTVAGLRHPHIVPIHALEMVDDRIAIDMEYVEGGSLADAGQNGGITRPRVCGLVRDILGALSACHEAGIVHRDVKPSNILIESDGAAMLSDFGLAKLLATHHEQAFAEGTVSSMFVGTPRYAPPEAWEGQEPTPAWDVYSVGMVLYEAMAGQTPYDATTPFAYLKQLAERPVPPLVEAASDVSQQLSDSVAAMLSRETAGRISTAGEALARLSQTPEFVEAAKHAPSTVIRRRAKPVTRLRRMEGTRKWRGVLLVGVACAVAVIGLMLMSMLLRPAVVEPIVNEPATLESPTLFDTVDASAGTVWPGHWLMRKGPDGALTALAYESTRLWYLRGVPDDEGNVQFEGYWAEYADESARVFLHGTLRGPGVWLRGRDAMTASIDFVSGQDASRWTRTFAIRRAAGQPDSAELLSRLERASFLQPLLYRELEPRSVPAVGLVEDELVSLGTQRMEVPGVTWEAGGPELDGRLLESGWRSVSHASTEAQGQMPGVPRDADMLLAARYDDKALYLALRAARPPSNPTIRVALVPGFSIPLDASPRYMVVLGDGMVPEARKTVRRDEQNWTCGWRAAESAGKHGWEAEVIIPYEGGDVGPARPGDRWRLVCAVEEDAGEQNRIVAEWPRQGSADVDPACGILLVFGDASPPPNGTP